MNEKRWVKFARGSQKTWEELQQNPEKIDNDTLYFIYEDEDSSTIGKLYLGKKLISDNDILNLENYYTKEEINDLIPLKISDLINDDNFITEESANNLILDAISNITNLHFEIVQEKPIENMQENVIYLILKNNPDENNTYEEWIYVNNKWELIGTTDIDLSQYYTKNEVDNLLTRTNKIFKKDFFPPYYFLNTNKEESYNLKVGDIWVYNNDTVKYDGTGHYYTTFIDDNNQSHTFETPNPLQQNFYTQRIFILSNISYNNSLNKNCYSWKGVDQCVLRFGFSEHPPSEWLLPMGLCNYLQYVPTSPIQRGDFCNWEDSGTIAYLCLSNAIPIVEGSNYKYTFRWYQFLSWYDYYTDAQVNNLLSNKLDKQSTIPEVQKDANEDIPDITDLVFTNLALTQLFKCEINNEYKYYMKITNDTYVPIGDIATEEDVNSKEDISNKVNAITNQNQASETLYPSVKAIVDYSYPVIETDVEPDGATGGFLVGKIGQIAHYSGNGKLYICCNHIPYEGGGIGYQWTLLSLPNSATIEGSCSDTDDSGNYSNRNLYIRNETTLYTISKLWEKFKIVKVNCSYKKYGVLYDTGSICYITGVTGNNKEKVSGIFIPKPGNSDPKYQRIHIMEQIGNSSSDTLNLATKYTIPSYNDENTNNKVTTLSAQSTDEEYPSAKAVYDAIENISLTPGPAGSNGASAYQIAVSNGYQGTEQQWLTSLIGASGTSGVDGKSAYQIAVDNGFVGTQQEWLASLVGQTGATGAQGPAGADWVPTSQELNDIAQRVINLLPDANEVNY